MGFGHEGEDGGLDTDVCTDGVEAWVLRGGVAAGDGGELGEEGGGARGVVGVVYYLRFDAVNIAQRLELVQREPKENVLL